MTHVALSDYRQKVAETMTPSAFNETYPWHSIDGQMARQVAYERADRILGSEFLQEIMAAVWEEVIDMVDDDWPGSEHMRKYNPYKPNPYVEEE